MDDVDHCIADETSTLDGSIFTIKSDTPMLDNEKKSKYRYGWCKFAPNFLQKLHNPKWLLTCLCFCAICQGMLINAFVPVAISTLEKRFQFSAFQLGLFVSCYDFAILVVQLPVCYFGEKGHKSRWLAIGMFLMGLGSAVCVVPQFISGIYRYEANLTQPEVCKSEESPHVATKSFEETILFYIFFLFGQILHGIGASPLYTLGVTFLNENVPKDSSPMYLGVFYGCSVLGPAIGYIIGGFLLRIYGDVWKVDLDMIKITHEDVRWYGAWWFCFMITSVIAVTCSVLISGFAKMLPNAPVHPEMLEIKKGHHEHHHKHNADTKSDSSSSSGDILSLSSKGIKGLWSMFKTLMKCKTWICLLVVDCLEGLPSTGIVAFFPKIIENFFAISSSTASLLTGCAIVPAAFLGNILGGFFIRKYHLQVSGMMLFALAFDGVAYFSILAFLAQCPRPQMAGVTVPYGYLEGDDDDLQFPVIPNLTHDCNDDCYCSKTLYNPVCDSNRSVIYYSACFAGCKAQTNGEYKDCKCLVDPYTNTSTLSSQLILSHGFCPKQCHSIIIFLVFFTLLVFTSFMTAIPIQESQLRTVPFELRTFAFGIRWIFVRLFATIPGPILFGYLVDKSCILWTEGTADMTRKVNCVIYDNPQLGYAVIVGGMVFKLIVMLFLFLARRTYLSEVKKNKSSVVHKNESQVTLQSTISTDTSAVSTSSFT